VSKLSTDPISEPPSRVRQILEAATAVFARRGFEDARIDDVAAEAGMAKGTVYLYFKSKDALIDALIGQMVERELGRLRDEGEQDKPVPERLAHFVHEYTHEVERLAPLAPVFVHVYSRATRNATVRRALQGYLDAFVEELAHLLELGVARGEIHAADPRAAALHLAALLEGIALWWAVSPDRIPLTATADAAVQTMLDGLSSHRSA
jgi:AcrR family transcriptional regulator